MAVIYYLSEMRRHWIRSELKLPEGLSDADLLNAAIASKPSVHFRTWDDYLRDPGPHAEDLRVRTQPVVLEGIDRTEHHY